MFRVLAAGVSLVAVLAHGQAAHGQDEVVDGRTVSVSGTPPTDYPSPWVIGGTLTVGDTGAGVLTVTNGGSVSASGFSLASQSGSSGTLNIGSAAGDAATAAGTVDAPSIAFGLGTGTIVFNHTGNPDGSDYSFAPVITGTGTINHLAGNTILTGSNSSGNNFTGTLNLTGGTLTVNGTFGDTSNNSATVNVTGNGKLAGAGTIAGDLTLDDGAVVSRAAGQSLTVTHYLRVGENSNAAVTVNDGGHLGTVVLFMGDGASGQGTITVTGANSELDVSGEIDIGHAGEGSLTIADGGKVNSAFSIIALRPTSTGTVTVTGTGSMWTAGSLFVGASGRGTLTVTDGGAVNSRFINIDGDGLVTVTGAGSSLTNTGNQTMIGSTEKGAMAITAGGVFTSTDTAIGWTQGSVGSVKVTGAGSTLITTSTIHLGDNGNGALTVADGGTVKAGTITIGEYNGSTGTLNIGSAAGDAPTAAGTVDAPSIAFGSGTGTIVFNHTGNPDGSDYSFAPVITGTGTINHLAGNTILTGSNSSGNNFTGTLNLTGGTLTVNGTFGDTSTSHTATINVTGNGKLAGSGTIAGNLILDDGAALSWQSGQAINVQRTLKVGYNGQASLSIDGGSQISTPVLWVGANEGSQGVVNLDGANTKLTATELAIGFQGDGTLNITGGSRVDAGLATFGFRGGSSVLTVTGPGSSLNVVGSLSIGGRGPAIVVVADGGLIASNYLDIGISSATVTGAGSSWTAKQSLELGGGNGTLSVLDGATFIVGGYAEIGDFASASNTLRVNGAGSSFTSTDDFSIGSYGGTGIVTIANGGALNVTNGSVLIAPDPSHSGSTGTLNIGSAAGDAPMAAGTVDAPSIAFGSGTGTIVFNHTGNPDGSDYSFAPVITGTGTINHLAGNTILTGSNSSGNNFTGTLNLSGGTLTVNGTFGDTSNNSATVNVTGNGKLAGAGIIAGNLTLDDGAALSWQSGQAINVQRYLKVGDDGQASLSIRGGSQISTQVLWVGANEGSQGVVNLDGANTTITATELAIGFKGDGTLNITGGSRVDARLATFGFRGGSAVLTVIGRGSSLNIIGQLGIGGNGPASVMVADGGLIAVGSLILTNSSTTVTGAGTSWTSTQGIELGGGDSTLSVLDGATFTVGEYAEIGASGNSTDTLRIDGAGSSFTSTNDVLIGSYGTGIVTVANGGALNVTNGSVLIAPDPSHSGSSGTLNIGSAAGDAATAAGTVDAPSIAFGSGTGTIVFNHTGNPDGSDYSFAPVITGTGTINHLAGNTILTGSNSSGNDFTGTLNLTGGTLTVNGTFGDTSNNSATVKVTGNGKLAGAGIIDASVSLGSGGALVGHSGTTTTIAGDLSLGSGATIEAGLGSRLAPALFEVNGNLVLDGTLNVSDDGGFGKGVYRLFDYGGTLTDHGLTIGATPAGIGASDLTVQTAVAGQINLVSTAGVSLSFWDGDNTNLYDNGRVDGGSGIWTAERVPVAGSWTDQSGSFNASYDPNPSFAVFQGSVGTVSIDDTHGSVGIAGMQFVSNGYVIQGDPLTLQGDGATMIRVGDGTVSGASVKATITSMLTGDSSLEKTDRGTLTLRGDNTYTGGTTILGGAIEITRDSNLGLSSGRLTLNGGTLATLATFSSGRAVTLGQNSGVFDVAATTELGLSGTISGAGDLIKQGSGTLRLTGTNNTYGNTRIFSGTLVGDTGSISGNIANAATVVFDQASDGTFAGNITGLNNVSGQMIKRGAASLSLTGSSEMNWRVEQGALISSASRFAGNVTIDSGASFTLNDAASAAYSGVLSGSGAFIKDGQGTLLLSGDSSGYAGSVEIRGGKLVVGGSGGGGQLGGSIVIGNGAILGGSGSIGNGAGSTVLLNAGGTISPGNSPGTLTINGNLVFASGARYDVEVVPGTSISDLIAVTGTAVLNGGSVVHVGVTGTYAPSATYTILRAGGGVTGTFDSISSNFAFLDPTLSYSANEVTLSLVRNSTSFADVASTQNQTTTASALEKLDANNTLSNAVAQQDAASARNAFDQLSGEIHASARTALIESDGQIRDAINDRIRAAFGDGGASSSSVPTYDKHGAGGSPARSDDGIGVWASGLSRWSRTSGNGNVAAFDQSASGLVLGVDAMVKDDWRLGIVGGYSRSSFGAPERASTGTSDNYYIGVYSGVQTGSFALRSGLSYSWHNVKISRSVALTGFQNELSADYGARSVQAFGELGYRVDLALVAFEPFFNVAYVNLSSDGVHEHGGAAALTADGDNTQTTFTTIGLRASSAIDLGDVAAKVRGAAGWRRAFGDITPRSTNRFAGSSAFTVFGAPIAKDAAVVDLGVELPISAGGSFSLSYEGLFSSTANRHGVDARLSVRF